MPIPNDKGPDQGRIVASLAVECHMPVAEMAALYERERAALAPTARIKQYLHIFVIRKVMDLLRRRRLSRPSGLPSQPARGTATAMAVASPASSMTSAPPRKSSAPPPVLTRRRLVLGTAAGGLLTPSLVACSASPREQDAALRLRQPMTAATTNVERRIRREKHLIQVNDLCESGHPKDGMWRCKNKKNMLLHQ